MFGWKQKNAAVLGCGPAGMFATHALVEAGWNVVLFSNKRRSRMFGAQYLHAPIPGLPEIRREVQYTLEGTPQEYADKVYGSLPAEKRAGLVTSAESLVGTHPAWDIRAAYDEAYDRYEHMIFEEPALTPAKVRTFREWGARKPFNLVLSSIPMPELCEQPDLHVFTSVEIWAIGDAPEFGQYAPISTVKDTVRLSGSLQRGWYRISNVFDHVTNEWPESRKPPLKDMAKVTKPISSNCDCLSKNGIQPIGRYGAWKKGALAHNAYQLARELAQ
jgi:hypothetical protein